MDGDGVRAGSPCFALGCAAQAVPQECSAYAARLAVAPGRKAGITTTGASVIMRRRRRRRRWTEPAAATPRAGAIPTMTAVAAVGWQCSTPGSDLFRSILRYRSFCTAGRGEGRGAARAGKRLLDGRCRIGGHEHSIIHRSDALGTGPALDCRGRQGPRCGLCGPDGSRAASSTVPACSVAITPSRCEG